MTTFQKTCLSLIVIHEELKANVKTQTMNTVMKQWQFQYPYRKIKHVCKYHYRVNMGPRIYV